MQYRTSQLSISHFIAIALVLSALLHTSAAAFLAGDINGSGSVTKEDLDEVSNVILRRNSSYPTDVDFDGATDAVDYQLVVRLILGHDLDTDDDGLIDVAEGNIGTDPNKPDTDGDGLNDGDEFSGDTSPTNADTDNDGLEDGEEVNRGTDPADDDTDDDGLSDGDEVNQYNTNPLDQDSDDDGLGDSREVNETVTDPNDDDTDGDGLSDGDEVNTHNTSPILDDSDGDGLTDPAEINTHNTDPNNRDSDGDGTSDGEEIVNGTNPNALDADLVITEFLAGNNSGLQDEDNNHSDWIEIHNPGTEAADLTGWFLTDTPNVPQRWPFPSVSIPAGGYLVVFASGLDRRPTDGGNLHTNFGLSVNGEYLAIVGAGGYIEHSYTPSYPSQVNDVSYGIFDNSKFYFTTPTPGAANSLGVLGFVESPKFSVPSSIYDAAFALELSSDTPGAVIRYTLDGSLPTPAHGTVFSAGNPVNVSGNTVIRAIAYQTNYVDSVVAAGTYLFLADILSQSSAPAGFPSTWGGPGTSNILINGDYAMDPDVLTDPAYSGGLEDALNSLPIVSLNMPIEDWFSAGTGIISNSWYNDNAGWTRAVSAEMFWPDGRPIFSVNCGIRVAGGQSTNPNWKSQKHSMRLKFQSEYGPTRLKVKEPFLPGTPFTSFNTLTLDARFCNTWHHWSEEQRTRGLHLRDIILNDLQIALDDVSPHGRYAHLFLNGLYWGMYWVHERPDESFLADYWGGTKEDYDVIKHIPSDVMAGTNQRYNAMLNLARSGTANPTVYANLASQYIQVGPFINYMLLNLWAGNDDWDHHNWYVGANRAEGSGFRYYSWDAEHILKEQNYNNTSMNNSGASTELHQLLLQNEEHKVRFGDQAHKLLMNGGLFTNDFAGSFFDYRVNEIYKALILESARWGDSRRDRGETTKLYTRDEHWVTEHERLRNIYLPQRAGIVLGQLRNRGVYPSVDAPTYNINGAYQHGGVIATGAVLTMDNPNGAGAIHYTLDGTDPRLAAEPGEVINLLEEEAPKRALVPTEDIGSDWRTQSGFDDAAWTPGTGGVGFETASGYDSLIGIDVETAMAGINGTCYIRIPFNVDAADLASLASLTLKARYDDGFVAYLNGEATPIAQALQPAALPWNAFGSGNHTDSAASQLSSFNISSALPALQAGANFLAIHALNVSITSSDFLFSVKLDGSTSAANPEISPSAVALHVNPPAPFTDTVRVLARALNNGKWSALNDAVYQIDTSDHAALRVTEVMYHPADPVPAGYYNDEAFEFVELLNTGVTTLDLSGVHFDRGIHFTFNDSTIRDPHLLAPGAYIVVAKNPRAFRARYGGTHLVAGPYLGSLNNGGETLRLADSDDATIVEFGYNNAWFQVTDGVGFSLTARDEVRGAALWDTKDAWRASSITGGTPGTGDTATVPDPGAIVINEVLAHSHAAAPDWIELHNTTNADIDASGWFLSDSNNNLKKYAFPANTIVPALGYLVVYEDQHFGIGNPGTPFALSENGETVYLSSGFNGQFTGYSEEEDFGASATGVAFGRYFKSSTGTYNFVPMSANTPGAVNAAPLIGPIVISEIMYHPPEAPTGNPDAEYIELYNTSGAPVTLEDPATNATWAVTDGIDFAFPPNTTIPAGGRILLVLNLTAFNAEHTGVTAPVFQWTSGRLNNGGERVQLSKPGDLDTGGTRQYIRVDRVTYSDAAPWPTSPDGLGEALHKTTLDAYGNDMAAWNAAAPSPGD